MEREEEEDGLQEATAGSQSELRSDIMSSCKSKISLDHRTADGWSNGKGGQKGAFGVRAEGCRCTPVGAFSRRDDQMCPPPQHVIATNHHRQHRVPQVPRRNAHLSISPYSCSSFCRCCCSSQSFAEVVAHEGRQRRPSWPMDGRPAPPYITVQHPQLLPLLFSPSCSIFCIVWLGAPPWPTPDISDLLYLLISRTMS